MRTNYNFEFSADTLKDMIRDSSMDKTKKEYLLKYSKDFHETYYELRNAIWNYIFRKGDAIKEDLFDYALSGIDMFEYGHRTTIAINTTSFYNTSFFSDAMNKLISLSSENRESICSSFAKAYKKELNRISSNLKFDDVHLKEITNSEKEVEKYEIAFKLYDEREDLY